MQGSEVVELLEQHHRRGKIPHAGAVYSDPVVALREKMQPVKGAFAFFIPAVDYIGFQAENVPFGEFVANAFFLDIRFPFHDENDFVCGGARFGVDPIGAAREQPHV